MITTLHGDCRQVLPTMPERSVQCVVTSPPYYGLRKYSDDPREIGQEAMPDCLAWARREPTCGACYVCAMRDVFAQLWRALRDDGVVWLNLGDSYGRGERVKWSGDTQRGTNAHKVVTEAGGYGTTAAILPDKNLLGIPWRVALALQADGWYLRSDCIWSKPNCMPESVTDRPTRAHEYVFLLAKSARYFYDADAIREPNVSSEEKFNREAARYKENGKHLATQHSPVAGNRTSGDESRFSGGQNPAGRNRRTVWSIATQPYSGAHYATMPEALIEPCILAGSSAQACEHCGAAWARVVEQTGEVQDRRSSTNGHATLGGTHTERTTRRVMSTTGFAPSCACPDNTGSAASVVLDPFGGSGTVGRVALRLQRRAVLIELNQAYIEQHIEKRTDGVQVELFV